MMFQENVEKLHVFIDFRHICRFLLCVSGFFSASFAYVHSVVYSLRYRR